MVVVVSCCIALDWYPSSGIGYVNRRVCHHITYQQRSSSDTNHLFAIDPTRFTIVQKVTRVPNGGPPTEEDPSIFSALYYFNYPPVNPNPYFPYQDQIQNPNQNQNQNPTLTPPSLWDTPNAYDSRECSQSPIDPFPHQPQPQPPLMLDTHTHTQIQAPFPSSSFPTHSFMDPTPSFDIDIDLNLNYGCL